jgi:hypothetical protein
VEATPHGLDPEVDPECLRRRECGLRCAAAQQDIPVRLRGLAVLPTRTDVRL